MTTTDTTTPLIWWRGIPLGWINNIPTAAGPQHNVLVIGPPRSGKTIGVVIPTIITAPGAVVATSTKPDIVGPTLGWRAAQGRCWYFDPSGTTTPPAGTNPSPMVAARRVRTLGHRTGPGPRLDHRRHRSVDSFARWWALERTRRSAPRPPPPRRHPHWCGHLLGAALGVRREITEPLRALGVTVCTELAKETLVGIAETDERERSGIFSTAARVLAAYCHQHALQAASEPNFDPASFVGSADTLYLVAPSHHQAQLAPIVVCLLDQIRQHTYTRGGNPPPVIFALDEVANIAPLPDLPAIVAEGAGQGLITLACLQDLHQARTRWGHAADGFLTLFAAKLALPGIADRDTLTQLSYLGGTTDVTYRTRNGQGFKGGWSQTIQQRPLYPPEQINAMPPGIAYLAHSNHRPHYISLIPPAPVKAKGLRAHQVAERLKDLINRLRNDMHQ